MTFEELAALDGYAGADPMPADFDEFWRQRMAEADEVPLSWQVEPAAELPSSAGCACFDLWFCGMGGARLYAKYLRPQGRARVPLVLQFHGYPGSSRSWFEQASFVGMGCALIALDNPGQGGKSEDVGGFRGTTVAGHLVAGAEGEPKDLYYVRLYQDLRILCRIVRAMGEEGAFDLARVFVNGASQGGGMGLACAALNPELINRAAILYPFLSDFRLVSELGADEIAYEGLRYWSRWFDPDGEHPERLFGRLAYYDTKNFAHLVRCPVLFGTGLADTVCPPQTQCAVYNQLGGPKRRYLYDGFRHEEIQDFDDLILGFFGEALAEGGAGRDPYAWLSGPPGGDADLLDGSAWQPDFAKLPFASFERGTSAPSDASKADLRILCPVAEGPYPLLVLFHDATRPPRGWHHLLRYVGFGWAVVQLDAAYEPAGASLRQADSPAYAAAVEEALAAYRTAAELAAGRVAQSSPLARADAARMAVFGEGFGGELALELARVERPWLAAAINPYPISRPLQELAEGIDCPVLLGTCGMDELADPAAQDELAARLPEVTHKHYPKYIHERVNAFENELFAFFASKE